MKHLPKHVRPRWRYLAVAIESWPDADIGTRDFQRAVWYAGQNLLGDPGSADADLQVMRFHHRNGRGDAIVRARHGHVDDARAALACVSDVDGAPVGIHVEGISGTIRACEEKYIRRRREDSGQRNVVFENAERSAVVRSPRYDVQTDDGYTGATELDFE